MKTAALFLPLAGVAVWLGLLLPLSVRLACAVGLSVVQLYVVPLQGAYLSVSLLASLTLWREVLAVRLLWKERWVWWFVALGAWQLTSLLWSPDKMMGVRNAIYFLPFLLVAFGAFRAYSEARPVLPVIWLVFAACLVAQAVFVVAFRLSPAAERAFLDSPLAGLFMSPKVVEGLLNGTAPGNILDDSKAGGLLYVNGNGCAAFLGIASLSLAAMASQMRSMVLISAAALAYVAVFFTGSKAGVYVALLIGMLLIWRAARRSARTRLLVIGVALLAVPIVLGATFYGISSGVFAKLLLQSVATLDSRQLIWFFAIQQFLMHPLWGLGFGGWEAGFAVYGPTIGLTFIFPPHNLFLILWSQSGLLAVVLGGMFLGTLLLRLHRMSRFNQSVSSRTFFLLLLALLWLVLQSMGENFALVEPHMMIPLAAAIGQAVAAMNHESFGDAAPMYSGTSAWDRK